MTRGASIRQLRQSGATDGQVPVWDAALGMWVPADQAGGGSGIPATLIDAKGDVIAGTADNTAARVPVGSNGQVLTADSTATPGLKWATPYSDPTTTKGDVPARSASALSRLPVGSDGQILQADSSQTLGLKWATPSTGVTFGLSDLGRSTIGASTVAWPAVTQVMKKITVPSGGGVILSVSVYTKQNASQVAEMIAGLLADSSGVPAELLAVSGLPGLNTHNMGTTARWLAFPIGVNVAAGDYWIAFFNPASVVTNSGHTLYFDATGSDRTLTPGANGWINDGANATNTVTANSYSMKATLLS